jgi:hypothetical protein
VKEITCLGTSCSHSTAKGVKSLRILWETLLEENNLRNKEGQGRIILNSSYKNRLLGF